MARAVLALHRMSAAGHSFETLFDSSPHVIAQAPAIAPLAGTTQPGMPLIAVALPLAMRVLVARRRDPVVHAASANVAGPARMVYVLGEETRWDAWVDYVQGVTLALRQEGLDVPGFDLLVRSDIPLHAGLGAGTALVVAVLRALRDAYVLELDDARLVALAHRAASTFRDDRSPALAAACAAASERAALVVRPDGGREAIALPDDADVTVLVAPARDAARAPAEPAPLAAARVDELAAALRTGDPVELGALLDTAPGRRTPLLEAARRHPAVFGARGLPESGAIVALVRRGEGRAVRESLLASHARAA